MLAHCASATTALDDRRQQADTLFVSTVLLVSVPTSCPYLVSWKVSVRVWIERF